LVAQALLNLITA